MNVHNLFKNVDIQLAAAAAGAAATDVTGNTIDTYGYDGVAFVASFGTLSPNTVVNMKLQGDTDPAGGTMADLAGSKTGNLGDTQSNTSLVIDLYRPAFRYVRPVVARGSGNAVLNGVTAILYHGELTPPAPVLNSPIGSAVRFLVQAPAGTA